VCVCVCVCVFVCVCCFFAFLKLLTEAESFESFTNCTEKIFAKLLFSSVLRKIKLIEARVRGGQTPLIATPVDVEFLSCDWYMRV